MRIRRITKTAPLYVVISMRNGPRYAKKDLRIAKQVSEQRPTIGPAMRLA
jgi:hypothetical protein